MTRLNQEVVIKNMTLRNRLVLPPITTNYGSPQGRVTEDILHFYTKRSRDVGLVIVESTAVQSGGGIVPGSLGLWEDDQISGMATLAKAIQDQGAMAVVQLNHAGPRCSPKKNERQGFSPSKVTFRPDVEPFIMDVRDIDQVTKDFAAAAVRAARAGFDGVEIHGAHLYLVSQFLSPLTNKREDRYGGDARGRATIALDIVGQVRKHLGPGYPIFFRINVEEKIDGGQSREDAVTMGRLLAEEGVDVFDVSLIAHGGWKEMAGKPCLAGSSVFAKDQPPGANIFATAAFKRAVGRPVIVVGKFGRGPAARAAVEDENIDMVAIGRQMICDPGTVRKILDGKDEEIIACDECLKCFATIGKGAPMGCKVNENLPF